jgi:3-hydroxyisobutyrate dehydrogenase-like beta-hydroxyacid dehydrogenase
MAVIAFIGFGELAAALADGLAKSKRHDLRAYLRSEPEGTRRERLSQTGVRHSTRPDVLAAATVVLSAVPGTACLAVAEQCAPYLDAGALYVDLASAAPDDKSCASESVRKRGAHYVDAAVLGTVVVSGHQVPILACGQGAEEFRSLVEPDGLVVNTLEGPPGQAALVKLLRSVYLKGRDALIAEMMLAARRRGLEEVVIDSLDGPSERTPFPALVERVLCSLALHAGRRSEELGQAAEVLAREGIDPSFVQAGAKLLRELGDLGLADGFGGERPSDASAVLTEIERRWPAPD